MKRSIPVTSVIIKKQKKSGKTLWSFLHTSIPATTANTGRDNQFNTSQSQSHTFIVGQRIAAA
jgi:hypothetical protein